MAESMAAKVLPDMAALSHPGHVRRYNQDYFFTSPERGLSIVCDGVGGQGDGAWASQEAIRLFAQVLDRTVQTAQAREAAIAGALEDSHASMFMQNQQGSASPSGTTIAGLWAPGGTGAAATAFNVGDSQIFHFSRGRTAKISRDHSLHQMWLDGGRIGQEPSRRTIVQAMGISQMLSPHLHSFRLEAGDAILLCTDGLAGALAPERMAEIVCAQESSRAACEILISEVLKGPARDNITVSVCYFR